MSPVIALVGRPNVGKSTLFNRLTKSRDALVADFPGLTRDRKYGRFSVKDRPFNLVDTGGIYITEETAVDQKMAEQSLQAAEDSDLIIWLVDARSGITAADEELAMRLRQMNKPFWLLVNKIDGLNAETAVVDFFSLGIERVFPVSASQGRGVRQLQDALLERFPDDSVPLTAEENEAEMRRENRIKVAILGRPNVGKSTLVNRILGEDRCVVFDMPGTTRDSTYVDFDRDNTEYTLIDTAGIRRRKNIKETVEKFSIVKTLKAIDDADVALLVMDASEGLVDQDLHLLGTTIKSGRPILIAFNKWDGLTSDDKDEIRNDLDRKLQFIDYVTIHTISALHGSGVGDLFD
ncbi:MAG: ribosome biogenesis GTPase Der, partial [Pseudomonadota bacterium]